jgi:hypothetical protein
LASIAGEEQNKIGCTNVTPFIRIGEFQNELILKMMYLQKLNPVEASHFTRVKSLYSSKLVKFS